MLEDTKTCRKTSLCLIVFEAAFLSLAEIPVSNFFEKFFEPEFFYNFSSQSKTRRRQKIELWSLRTKEMVHSWWGWSRLGGSRDEVALEVVLWNLNNILTMIFL